MDKKSGFPYNGTELMQWILQQHDCWVEEHLCFHIGNLQARWIEQNPEFNNLDRIQQEQARRVIRLEAHLAKHYYKKPE